MSGKDAHSTIMFSLSEVAEVDELTLLAFRTGLLGTSRFSGEPSLSFRLRSAERVRFLLPEEAVAGDDDSSDGTSGGTSLVSSTSTVDRKSR